MAVFCSDGPENGARVPLSRPPEAVSFELGHERHRFDWDGTYDEHGEARYRPAADAKG